MINLRIVSALTVLVASFGLGAPVRADTLSISGGMPATSIPQGTSGNSVLAQAGIGFAGGQLWIDGSLDNLGDVTLTLYDVGSESHWDNFLLLGNSSGDALRDMDDHYRGSSGNFTNGPAPYQLAGSVTQPAGLTDMWFVRLVDQEPELVTVINGQSPMMNVPGYDFASIALAYLDTANQIVSTPTDRVLVMLEDGGADRDYDDYVGILDTGAPPAVRQYSVSQTTLQFGEVPVGTDSPAMSYMVRNTGNVALPIASIAIKGNNKYQFSQSSDCPDVLAVGGACSVSVVFSPTFLGDKSALSVVQIEGGALETAVKLRGSVSDGPPPATPTYSVAPTNVQFGDVDIGTTSTASAILVTNTGSLSLPLVSISITGGNSSQFFQTNNCPASLAAGAACTVSATFNPTSPGDVSATLVVQGGDGSGNKSVQLQGTGTDVAPPGQAAYAVSATTLQFGYVPRGTNSAPKTFEIRSTGSIALPLQSIAVGGNNKHQFSLTHDCPASLPAGGTCTVSVIFSPTFAGDKSALAIVQAGGGAPDTSVKLRGTTN